MYAIMPVIVMLPLSFAFSYLNFLSYLVLVENKIIEKELKDYYSKRATLFYT